MTRAGTAVYLYCVIGAAKRPTAGRAPGGLTGASRPDVHAVAPSLWIVTADVPLDVYGPARLEPRLRDLDWVSQAALAHEAVIEHFSRSRRAAVVPMKLFTLFSTLDTAVRDVAARGRDIRRTLRHISGADEWGVRVFRRPASPAPRTAAPATGADFLRARKHARDASDRTRAAAAAAADAAFARLRRHARDARVRQTRREGGTNPPILDAAFLVPARTRARFRTEARRQATSLARGGAELILTGPWPAYHFVVPGDPA